MAARAHIGLVLTGVAVALVLAGAAMRAPDPPPATAKADVAPPPCSSCDARHARLRDARIVPQEVRK